MDATSSASRTALMVAGLRAVASARPEPVCQDPWASALAGSDGLALAEQFDRVNPVMELWIALRTAWIDGRVKALCGAGSGRDQVVVLGAGLDARAARLARPGLHFFEVDHPQTQAEKKARLAKLEHYPPEASTFAPCDFGQDDFLERLEAVGFDSGAPALFVWEGVVPYLQHEAVLHTLRRVADGCHGQSIILFDYVMKKMVAGEHLDAADAQVREMVGGLGEPLTYGLNDPTPLLYEAGFRHLRTVSFDELALSLTHSYERSRKFRFQGLVIASKDHALEF